MFHINSIWSTASKKQRKSHFKSGHVWENQLNHLSGATNVEETKLRKNTSATLRVLMWNGYFRRENQSFQRIWKSNKKICFIFSDEKRRNDDVLGCEITVLHRAKIAVLMAPLGFGLNKNLDFMKRNGYIFSRNQNFGYKCQRIMPPRPKGLPRLSLF